MALGLLIGALAGVAAAQMGPCAVQTGSLLPDLIVDAEKLKTWRVAEERISASSCALIEGCLTTAGKRKLLRFTSSTPNIGEADLIIGDPFKCIGTLFQYSPCHGHLHLNEYADYRLWTPAGYAAWSASRDWSKPTSVEPNRTLLANAQASGALVVGRKQGFCLIDLTRYWPTAPGPTYTSCASNQGISVGWADEYYYRLDCQFIDVTGVAPGTYVLEDEVNPERLFKESNYRNNAASIQLEIKGKGR
jgi:hypothetical protein